jgi:hypothetical protein
LGGRARYTYQSGERKAIESAQAAAQAQAAHNQAILQQLDSFRGANRDPNGHYWDEVSKIKLQASGLTSRMMMKGRRSSTLEMGKHILFTPTPPKSLHPQRSMMRRCPKQSVSEEMTSTAAGHRDQDLRLRLRHQRRTLRVSYSTLSPTALSPPHTPGLRAPNKDHQFSLNASSPGSCHPTKLPNGDPHHLEGHLSGHCRLT